VNNKFPIANSTDQASFIRESRFCGRRKKLSCFVKAFIASKIATESAKLLMRNLYICAANITAAFKRI